MWLLNLVKTGQILSNFVKSAKECCVSSFSIAFLFTFVWNLNLSNNVGNQTGYTLYR